MRASLSGQPARITLRRSAPDPRFIALQRLDLCKHDHSLAELVRWDWIGGPESAVQGELRCRAGHTWRVMRTGVAKFHMATDDWLYYVRTSHARKVPVVLKPRRAAPSRPIRRTLARPMIAPAPRPLVVVGEHPDGSFSVRPAKSGESHFPPVLTPQQAKAQPHLLLQSSCTECKDGTKANLTRIAPLSQGGSPRVGFAGYFVCKRAGHISRYSLMSQALVGQIEGKLIFRA